MKRTELGNGAKSEARGSTFSAERKPIERRTELNPVSDKRAAATETGGRPRYSTLKRGDGFAASPAQRKKVKGRVSIVSGDRDECSGDQHGCDPAHVWPRSLGGCDDALCVVPLTRAEHDAYDNGRLELLPHLIAHQCYAELAHALEHARGDVIALLERLTAMKWQPIPNEIDERGAGA